MSFTRKRIDVTITLGTGQFGDTGANQVTLSGLRVSTIVQAVASIGDAMPQTQTRIFGLPFDMMCQLTAVGLVNSAVRFNNAILIAAGDDESGLTTIYDGTIMESWADLAGQPDAVLNVTGVAGLAASLKPVGALSFEGATDVATIMQGLAETMGLTFENNGVSVQLSNPYFPGTALAQARSCARAADIFMLIDRGVLAIWPKSGARNSGDTPLVSPDTGMIGYPMFSSNGIGCVSLFNPLLKPGGIVQIDSSLPPACGTWRMTEVSHTLESETPNGQWFTRFLASPQSNG